LSQETKIKGYINIQGYKVLADENVNPGRYGFRIIHDSEKPHYFSSEEQIAVRDWMKALMKATIGRDYTSMSFGIAYHFFNLIPLQNLLCRLAIYPQSL
jgi:hypothetical protein